MHTIGPERQGGWATGYVICHPTAPVWESRKRWDPHQRNSQSPIMLYYKCVCIPVQKSKIINYILKTKNLIRSESISLPYLTYMYVGGSVLILYTTLTCIAADPCASDTFPTSNKRCLPANSTSAHPGSSACEEVDWWRGPISHLSPGVTISWWGWPE